jgi:hypothetical protein
MNDSAHDTALGLGHSWADAEITINPSTISILVSEPQNLGF